MRKLSVWLLAFVLVFISIGCSGCGPKKPVVDDGVKKSVLIPADQAKDAGDWEFPVVANSGEFGIGDTVRLSEVVKNPDVKVVLVDYWATWCEPCKEEMPYLQEIYLAKKSEGLCPLVITIDNSEGLKNYIIKAVKNMKWKKDGKPANITFTIPWDMKSESKTLYGIGAIPVTFLVDKNNKIRYQHSGFSEELVEDLKVAIDELLAEK